MREERTIAQAAFGRVPLRRLSWPAIFGGAFFALGVMLVLSLFGVAIGAAAAGATQGVRVWAGIWSLVTIFLSFLAGGWLAAKASSVTRVEGRLHGLVTWGLGITAIFYFAVNSTTRIAGAFAGMTGNIGQNVTPGLVQNVTATAAGWAVIVTLVGLIGAIVGGHAGAYVSEAAAAAEVRRAA
jgi:hypothetical protein